MNEPETLELVETDSPAPSPAGALVVTGGSPIDRMMQALDRGIDLAKVEKMLELQERWERNEARKEYNTAFAAFKAEAVRVIRNRAVTDGPLKGKSYAELHSVVDAVTPALSKHGLSTSWRVTRDEPTWIEVTCILAHSSGHQETVSIGGPPDTGGAKNPIQARNSTISYLERYTLKAICGVAEGGDDDDGNGGQSQASDAQVDAALQAGREAAMRGMADLTTWWGSLDAKNRGKLQRDFAGLRKAAKEADDARS